MIDEAKNQLYIDKLPSLRTNSIHDKSESDSDSDDTDKNDSKEPFVTAYQVNSSENANGDESTKKDTDDRVNGLNDFEYQSDELSLNGDWYTQEFADLEPLEERISLIKNNLDPSPGAPMIKVKIKNGKNSGTFFATIDTGAERTIITDEYLRNNFESNDFKLQQVDGLNLTGAGSNRLKILGSTECRLDIGGKKIDHKIVVIEGKGNDLLIGSDIIRDHFILDGNKLIVKNYDGKQELPLFYRKERYPVYPLNRTTIRPNEEKFVEVRLKECHKNLHHREMLFVPNNEILSSSCEIQVVPTATVVDNTGMCVVRAYNKKQAVCYVKRGEMLGYVYHTSVQGDQILTLNELKNDEDWMKQFLDKDLPDYILKKGAYAKYLNDKDLIDLKQGTSTCTGSSRNVENIKICIEREELEPFLDENGCLNDEQINCLIDLCLKDEEKDDNCEHIWKIHDLEDRKAILDGLKSPHFPEPGGDEKGPEINTNNWIDGLKTDHLSKERAKQVKDLVLKYKDAFVQHKHDTSRFKYFMIKLPMKKGASPVQQKYRPIPMRHQKIAQETIDDLLLTGKISPSTSNYASNLCIAKRVIMVKGKQEIKYRLCFDARQINACLKECKHPNISMQEAFAKISNAKYKSMMDVAAAFQNLVIAPNQRHRLAFYGPGHRLYEYNVLPYGLNLSLSAWLIAINCVTSGLDNVIAFVDDLAVWTPEPHSGASDEESFQSHMKYVEILLNRLVHAGVKVSLSKCRFGLGPEDETTWLGHNLSSMYMKPDKSKIEAIINFPEPLTAKQALAFISMVGFYRMYIAAFSVFAAVFYKAIKAEKYEFTSEMRRVFKLLKKKITEEPVLATVKEGYPFKIYCDASANCIAAVLEQEQANGLKSKPIAYASRQLNEQEIKLSNPLKELLAIVYALTTWQNIVFGHETTIYTDARCWSMLKLTSSSSARMSRLGLFFSEFPLLNVCHIKGKDNKVADALSRAYMETYNVKIEDPKVLKDPRLDFIGHPPITKPVRLEQYLVECEKYLETNWPPKAGSKKRAAKEAILGVAELNEDLEKLEFRSEFLARKRHLQANQSKIGFERNDIYQIDCTNESEVQHVISRVELELEDDEDSRIMMVALNQTCFTPEAFAALQRNDLVLRSIINRLENKVEKISEYDNFVLRKGVLMFKSCDKNQIARMTIVIPETVKGMLLKYYHDHMSGRGYGSTRMERTMRKFFYWRTMHKDIKRVCDSCLVCAYNSKYPKGMPMGGVLTPSYPNQIIYIDILEALPVSYDGKSAALAIYDHFSRFIYCIPLSNTKAEYIAQQFTQQFLQWNGAPMYIRSDQGRNVSGNVINYICTMLGIKKVETEAYNPQADVA